MIVETLTDSTGHAYQFQTHAGPFGRPTPSIAKDVAYALGLRADIVAHRLALAEKEVLYWQLLSISTPPKKDPPYPI